MTDRYPHYQWQIDGRPVIVTGEFVDYVDGRPVTGYTYRFEDSPASEMWIDTAGSAIRARKRTDAKQISKASPNDASSGTQSEVRQEDGHPQEGGEGIRPSGREAQAPLKIVGMRHVAVLSDSEVMVAHPNYPPMIFDFATGKGRPIE